MFRLPRSWIRALWALVVAYALLLGVLMIFEDKLIYFPAPYPEGEWDIAARSGTAVEDVWITTEDGVRIHGWWVPAPTDTARTLLFFHGNAGNLTGRFPWIRTLSTLPANVLIIDYRGYGRSEGKPDEQGLYRDAKAAWDYLITERAVPAREIVLYGNSLGGGVASWLATETTCRALILANTFRSVPDMARRQFPFVPKALIRTRMDTHARLPGIEVPVLIIHSRGDRMIPVTMARDNYAAANEPKHLLEVEDADHNEVTYRHGPQLFETIRQFLRETGNVDS